MPFRESVQPGGGIITFGGVLMGIVFVLAWFTAIVKFHAQGSSLWVVSLILGLMNLWALGILWNYRNSPFTPRLGGALHMVTSALSIVFAIAALIRK